MARGRVRLVAAASDVVLLRAVDVRADEAPVREPVHGRRRVVAEVQVLRLHRVRRDEIPEDGGQIQREQDRPAGERHGALAELAPERLPRRALGAQAFAGAGGSHI